MPRITTREYKLILSPDRFADRHAGEQAFRRLVHGLATKAVRIDDQEDEETRRTWYLDTPDFALRNEGFALRIRFEEARNAFKISLKHRTPDRYLAAAKDVASPSGDPCDRKFEEDILPPFRSLFSRSNSLYCGKLPKFRKFADAIALFPGLDCVASRRTQLVKVNDFEAREIFRKLCRATFGKKEKHRLNIGLSYWYGAGEEEPPLIAECAFDYSTKKGDCFPLKTVEGANRLFDLLQKQSGWFDLGATTKTAYAYEGL